MSARKTPVMEQHAAAKRAYPDSILFFRMGDFYEMFGDDAVLGARLLDLTLTSRSKGKPDEVAMAGVPHHAAHGYIARLLELGHKVAICEQMADPATVKGIVPRQVVRVITPGLITDRDQLDASTNNYLAAVEIEESVALALLDLSTGELRVTELFDLAAALGELSRAAPREILLGPCNEREQAEKAIRLTVPNAPLRADGPLEGRELPEAFADLAGDAARLNPLPKLAVARVLRFARQCNPGVDLPVRRIGTWNPSAALIIDPVAQTHLELVSSAQGRSGTLLSVIDATCTAPGARLLRRRLLAPLTDVERIRRRLDLVEAFVIHARVRSELRDQLREVSDLERLSVRAALGEATPRDLGALRNGLVAARAAVELLEGLEDRSLREVLGIGAERIDTVSDLADELERALVERPPAVLKEGGLFRSGFDSELDELATLKQSGAEHMVALEAELREQTGISTLKVRYTRVFGWYIEVSRGQAGRVPDTFRRKQTVATGERYSTDKLDDLADRIAHAEDRHRERELLLFRTLLDRARSASDRVAELSRRIARWDVAAALADVAHRYDYARPVVNESERLELSEGRHPVVERMAAAGRFVPNDLELDTRDARLWLITGPNMAGKSTFLRQVALITILAQMGSYVPASAATVGVVDRVLSRVGASDNLARGESTFMVEMKETAEILRSATRKSLVILDEIGRGTSTFDGLAIAWAVAEHLDEAIGCRALFATHYHELTALSESSEHVANHSVSAREINGDVVFLHRLVQGSTSRSYGIEVAKLAGVPESVLARARAVLAGLEQGRAVPGQPPPKTRLRGGRSSQNQLGLFESKEKPGAGDQEVLATLRTVDIERMTPLDALQLLAKLKARL